MRPGAWSHVHEAVRYGSDTELLEVVVPFLTGGPLAGEPTFVACGERTTAVIRDALPSHSGVDFLPSGETYSRPAGAIRAYRSLVEREIAAGAEQIRIVGEVPAAGSARSWDGWARYESAINHAFDGFPLWCLCPYDERVTPGTVLDDVARTHPRFARPGGRSEPSGTYTSPARFLGESRPLDPDPLQAAPPAAVLVDPTPAAARDAVRALCPAGLAAATLDELLLAVSETTTNAYLHGQPPFELRAWAAPGRIVVTVTDRGEGPQDPYAGLLPATGDSPGGYGLWITHQSCTQVTAERHADGWTITMVAGNPE